MNCFVTNVTRFTTFDSGVETQLVIMFLYENFTRSWNSCSRKIWIWCQISWTSSQSQNKCWVVSLHLLQKVHFEDWTIFQFFKLIFVTRAFCRNLYWKLLYLGTLVKVRIFLNHPRKSLYSTCSLRHSSHCLFLFSIRSCLELVNVCHMYGIWNSASNVQLSDWLTDRIRPQMYRISLKMSENLTFDSNSTSDRFYQMC